MIEFRMPSLGADMEAGTLVEWLVQPGDRVQRGDVVAVVETQKGAIDIEIFNDGVIAELTAPVGERVPVGAVLARIDGAAATPTPPAAPPPSSAAVTPPAAAPSAPPAAAPSAPPAVPPPSPAAPPAPPAAPSAPPAAPTPSAAAPPSPPAAPTPSPAAPTAPQPLAQAAATRRRISPAARRIAAERGIDIQQLPGTGPDGAIIVADVEAAERPAPPAEPRRRRTGFDPAAMRQAIAAAMSRSKREIPHYYLTQTIDVSAALARLDRLNADRSAPERVLPAALFLRAIARAVAKMPELNGFWENGRFRPGEAVHVGWAIVLRGGGLVAPAIRDADRRSLDEIMAAMRDLVLRARSGGLRSSEFTDPTITVTSLGERGAETVLPIIYPPQVAMVGVGRIVTRPWVVDGAIGPRPIVTFTLAGDHRASDGHRGGLLLAEIDRLLQEAETL